MGNFTKVLNWAEEKNYNLINLFEEVNGIGSKCIVISNEFIFWEDIKKLEIILNEMDLFIYSIDKCYEGLEIWFMQKK